MLGLVSQVIINIFITSEVANWETITQQGQNDQRQQTRDPRKRRDEERNKRATSARLSLIYYGRPRSHTSDLQPRERPSRTTARLQKSYRPTRARGGCQEVGGQRGCGPRL